MNIIDKNFICKDDGKKIKEMDRLKKWTVHFGKYKNESLKSLPFKFLSQFLVLLFGHRILS